MKRVLLTLLSSLFLLSLTACGQERPSSQEDSFPSASLPQETYYHVTFINEDESVLYEIDVLEGEEAIYNGDTPVKEEDDEFAYEFIGWDQDLTSITADITTTALFEAVAKENWGPIIWF